MATRTSIRDDFGVPKNMQAINTADIEAPSWISADGCVLYFTKGHLLLMIFM